MLCQKRGKKSPCSKAHWSPYVVRSLRKSKSLLMSPVFTPPSLQSIHTKKRTKQARDSPPPKPSLECLSQLTLLTSLKEDGILRGLKDGVAFRVHDDHIHLKCGHAVLFAETREANLNNYGEKKVHEINLTNWSWCYRNCRRTKKQQKGSHFLCVCVCDFCVFLLELRWHFDYPDSLCGTYASY